jgi:DNA-binding NtrC family response regulator
MMTGYGTIDMAVQAIKDGAYDFLQKPFEKDHIVRILQKCLERTRLLRSNRQLQDKLDTYTAPEGFVGQSAALKQQLDLLAKVADSDATVLIRGQSGTGKELAARALHNLSNRKKKKMVVVNCPALPESVLESELFGYSKGAFTGAVTEKRGLFFEAQGSTIVLDEIADIPVSIQTKLLRVLQEKEIQPLGQNKTFKVDVRVIASTNQDLEAKIKSGEFREDLFYRLNVVTVTMPNLVDIKDDIPLLIHHFVDRFKKQYERFDFSLNQATLKYLYNKEWPGNVRQLKNTIQRMVLLDDDDSIAADTQQNFDQETAGQKPSQDVFGDLQNLSFKEAKALAIQHFTENYLDHVLTLHHGNVTNAAAYCGLDRQALQRTMRRYGIVSADYKK